MSQANDGTGPVIVYVVVYDEPDEPSEVCGVFSTRELADAYIDGADTMYVDVAEVDKGLSSD
jgi:hypothetical protein